MIDPKPYSIYLRGTIIHKFALKASLLSISCGCESPLNLDTLTLYKPI